MTRSNESALLGAALLVMLLGGGAGWWFLSGTTSEQVSEALGPGAGVAPAAPLEPSGQSARLESPELPATDGRVHSTTVIWPLEVELDLLEPATFDAGKGIPPLGSGANAALEGHVYDENGAGMSATLTFVAGPNTGRVLACDASGAYGSKSLYPGLSILQVETPLSQISEREVRLVSRKTQKLTLGFGALSSVYGTVVDSAGEPIQGAHVRLDGKDVYTDDLGEFAVRDVVSGKSLAFVYKPGFMRYRESLHITRASTISRDKLQFRLARGCTLEITIQERIGAAGEAQVFLLPAGQQPANRASGQRTFPWHSVSPISLYPGGTALVEGLPEGRIHLMVFHSGAQATQTISATKLVAGRENQVVLHIEPARKISGTVRRQGKAFSGASVVLEAPNRTSATARALGQPDAYLATLVIPHLPSARQEVTSDGSGRFYLTSYGESGSSYLIATADGGRWRASKVVEPDATDVVLDLEEMSDELGTLTFGMPGRFQGLPVEVRVQGAPRGPQLLEPEEDLVVADLPRGTWRLSVQWHGKSVVRRETLELDDGLRRMLDLPLEAIEGQSPEERSRAGR